MEGYAVGQNAFGFALPRTGRSPAGLAYVFGSRVEGAARRHGRVRMPTLLAHVIVHEIRHLLFGPGMHFDRGIMKPRWTSNDLREMEAGRLVFPSDQARLLRSRVATPNGSAAADLP